MSRSSTWPAVALRHRHEHVVTPIGLLDQHRRPDRDQQAGGGEAAVLEPAVVPTEVDARRGHRPVVLPDEVDLVLSALLGLEARRR